MTSNPATCLKFSGAGLVEVRQTSRDVLAIAFAMQPVEKSSRLHLRWFAPSSTPVVSAEDIRQMRQLFSEEFFQRFAMAYRNYEVPACSLLSLQDRIMYQEQLQGIYLWSCFTS